MTRKGSCGPSYLPMALEAPHFHFLEKSLAAKKNRNKTKITVPPNGHQKNKGVLLPSLSLFFMGCCQTKFVRKHRLSWPLTNRACFHPGELRIRYKQEGWGP